MTLEPQRSVFVAAVYIAYLETGQLTPRVETADLMEIVDLVGNSGLKETAAGLMDVLNAAGLVEIAGSMETAGLMGIVRAVDLAEIFGSMVIAGLTEFSRLTETADLMDILDAAGLIFDVARMLAAVALQVAAPLLLAALLPFDVLLLVVARLLVGLLQFVFALLPVFALLSVSVLLFFSAPLSVFALMLAVALTLVAAQLQVADRKLAFDLDLDCLRPAGAALVFSYMRHHLSQTRIF